MRALPMSADCKPAWTQHMERPLTVHAEVDEPTKSGLAVLGSPPGALHLER